MCPLGLVSLLRAAILSRPCGLFWYPIAERFDDEGESGATLERPGLAKLLRRIEEGDVHRVIVYRVDRLTRKLTDLARLAEFFERLEA